MLRRWATESMVSLMPIILLRESAGFHQRRGQILPGQRREVIEHHRQGDAVGHLLEIADQVCFRHLPVVGVITTMPSAPACCACWLSSMVSGVGAAGADQHRHPTIDMIDSKAGNGLTLFGAELGELAAAAQKNRPSTPAAIRSSISAAVPCSSLAVGGKMVETGE